MKEEAVIAIIRRNGSFQINPATYRDERKRKTLQAMVKKGILQSRNLRSNCREYFLKGES